MTILVVINYRPERGGITDQVVELAKDLRSENIYLDMVSTYGTLWERARGMLSSFKRGKDADMILGVGCGYFGFLPMAVAALAAWVLRKPVLYNFHDGQAEVFLQEYGWLVKKILGQNRVIVASEFVARAFRERGLQVSLIPNHFHFGKTLNGRSRPFAWNGKVLWARSFHEIYQPELALRAAVQVLERNPDCEFHFFGDGELHEELRECFRHPRLFFRGFVPRSEFLQEYENFSVFLNTTVYDNFPLSLVEAGFYELLVISTPAGGIASTYNEHELVYVAENKAETLAELLLDVLENPAHYDEYRQRIHQKVMSFNWQNVKEKWLRSIAEAVN